MSISELLNNPAISYTNLNVKSFNAESVTIDTLVVDDLDAKVLTLSNVASVPNPAVGKVTVFSNLSNVLSTNNSLGDVIKYVADDGSVPMNGNLNMALHNIDNIGVLNSDSNIVLSSTNGSNIVIGQSAAVGSTGSVAIGGGANAVGFQNVAVGPVAVTGAGNFSVAVGRTASATGGGDVALGNNANSSAGSSVVIGSNAVSAGANSVSIGRSATCANTGTQEIAIGFGANATASNGIALGVSAAASAGNAIAIGFSAVNSVANSCLIGSSGILNLRANDANTCDLGTSANAFNSLYCNALRVRQVANGTAGGIAVLVAGTVTVATTAVNTGDIVLLSRIVLGGTLGFEYISALVDGVSFTISSSSNLDTSTFSWVIIKQV